MIALRRGTQPLLRVTHDSGQGLLREEALGRDEASHEEVTLGQEGRSCCAYKAVVGWQKHWNLL